MTTTTAPAAPDFDSLTMDEMVAASETSPTGTLQVTAFCDGCDDFTECTIDAEMIPLCKACI